MKILQKILSIIIMLCLLMMISPLNAEVYNQSNHENILLEEVIKSKISLQKIKNWTKYVNKINKIINKIKDNREALYKLQIKIFKIKDDIYGKTKSSKTKKALAILDYIETKSRLELYRISLKKIENKKNVVNKKLEEMKNSNLSEEENKRVNEKLVKIQLNLLENANNKINNLVKDFENFSNYEGKGDLKFNFNLDIEPIWKIKTELELNDYIYKNSGFNSQISGQFKSLFDIAIKWEDNMKFKVDSFLDFINKDWDSYLLLNELNITNEVLAEDLKEYFKTLEKIAEKNKYIKLKNNDTREFFEMLEKFNLPKILNDGKEALWKPMFKAYKKEGDKYSLTPTKYACDKFKELTSKFDLINGSKCSESQYESMIKLLAENGELYIEIWDNKNKLGFNMYKDFNGYSFNSYIIFTNTSINEIKSEMKTTKWDELFILDYKKNNKLNLKMNILGVIISTFNWNLNNNNEFTSIDLNIYSEDFKSNIKLRNKKISGITKVIDRNWKEFINIAHSWKYEKNYLKFNNKIKLSESIINTYLGQINKPSDTIRENPKVEANINIMIDTRFNKDNSNIYIDYIEWSKKVLEIEANNKSSIEYKKIEIKTPSNIMNLNEVL